MMKKITLITTAILLVLNLLCGLLLSAYKPFNWGYSSIIILITGGLIYLLQCINIKDAFAISLTFFIIFLGIVGFILAILSPTHIQDNGFVITTLVLIAIQSILLITTYLISNKV